MKIKNFFCHALVLLVYATSLFHAEVTKAACSDVDLIWHELQQRDKAVSQGTLFYLQTHGLNSGTFKTKIEYLPDLRFRKKQEPFGRTSFGTEIPEVVYDGEDWFNITSAQIVITPGPPIQVKKGMFAVDIAPKPSLPMGRGLSNLKQRSITVKGHWATIKGIAEDNSRVTAEVDLADHFLARKIIRCNPQGKLLGVIRTRGELGNGAVAAYSSYSGPYSKGSWNFLKADFSPPPTTRFSLLLPAGVLIADQRLGTLVAIRKTTLGGINKKEVLKIAQIKLSRQANLVKRVQEVNKAQNAINALMILLPFFLFGIWFSLKRAKVSLRSAQEMQ